LYVSGQKERPRKLRISEITRQARDPSCRGEGSTYRARGSLPNISPPTVSRRIVSFVVYLAFCLLFGYCVIAYGTVCGGIYHLVDVTVYHFILVVKSVILWAHYRYRLIFAITLTISLTRYRFVRVFKSSISLCGCTRIFRFVLRSYAYGNSSYYALRYCTISASSRVLYPLLSETVTSLFKYIYLLLLIHLFVPIWVFYSHMKESRPSTPYWARCGWV